MKALSTVIVLLISWWNDLKSRRKRKCPLTWPSMRESGYNQRKGHVHHHEIPSTPGNPSSNSQEVLYCRMLLSRHIPTIRLPRPS